MLAGSANVCPDAQSAAVAAAAAGGYPVMLKAVGGGGGRGMRVCAAAEQLEETFGVCTREAAAAFGESGVFVESLVMRVTHPAALG